MRYQEAVEALHRVQAEWGPLLGLEVSIGTSPRTVSSKSSYQTRDTSSGGIEGGGVYDKANTDDQTGSSPKVRSVVRNEVSVLASTWSLALFSEPGIRGIFVVHVSVFR